MFLFSDFVPDPELRYQFGWVYLGLLAFLFLVNFIVIGYKVFLAVRRFRELVELKKHVLDQQEVSKKINALGGFKYRLDKLQERMAENGFQPDP